MSTQKVNSQSQSGAASCCDTDEKRKEKYDHHDDDPKLANRRWHGDSVESEAEVEKRVKIHIKADDGCNAQAQGQVVQCDRNWLSAKAKKKKYEGDATEA